MMRIAITTRGKSVAEEFGRSISFTIYEVAEGKTRGRVVINVSDSGGGDALLFILRNERVEVLLCGRIEQGVRCSLEKNGIEVIEGLRGSVNRVLKAYLLGRTSKNIK